VAAGAVGAAGQACLSSSDAPDAPDGAGDATTDTDVAQPVDTGVTDAPDEHLGIDAACTTQGGVDADPDAPADADPGCWYTLPCGFPDSGGLVLEGCELFTKNDDGGTTDLKCRLTEHKGCEADAYAPGANGEVTMDCIDCLGGAGRRTAGIARPRPARASTCGRLFAQMAHDEAASVLAFVRMQGELAAHGAPRALARSARRAAADERRHAKTIARLAARHGATPASPRLRGKTRARSLEAFAKENAIEGQIGETFGALVLAWQAEHAPEELRATFREIAEDELRHAALAWSIARWADTRLDDRARARVARARARAFARLQTRLATRGARPADDDVGHPPPAIARSLASRLAVELGLV
jgi:hypothetical protein